MPIFPNWVEKYIGIPYKSKGRDPEEGIDCWGLVKIVYENEFGVDLPSYDEGYKDAHNRKDASKKIGKSLDQSIDDGNWKTIEMEDLKEGDILIIDIAGIPCHIGIYVGCGHVMHVREGTLTCIEDYESKQFAGKIRSGYRYIGD